MGYPGGRRMRHEGIGKRKRSPMPLLPGQSGPVPDEMATVRSGGCLGNRRYVAGLPLLSGAAGRGQQADGLCGFVGHRSVYDVDPANEPIPESRRPSISTWLTFLRAVIGSRHGNFPLGCWPGKRAEIDVDLLVIGTRGRSGIAKVLLGSVAEEILRIVDVDILAVPPVAARA